VFQRSLAKRPAERYATCGEMVETLESALIRRAPAPTRLTDAARFAFARPAAPEALERSWAARNLSREALTYFGITFAVCAFILGGIFYLLLPKAPPKVIPVTPPAANSQPVAPPPGHAAKAKPASRSHVKPVEPKAIRQ
jgi:hypothetical protein